MNQLLAIFAPIGLLLAAGPAVGALPQSRAKLAFEVLAPEVLAPDVLAKDSWHQVRIEQHFSIRISPGAPMLPPDMLEDLQQDDDHPPGVEGRNIGKCVSIHGLMGAKSASGNRLLLFMRDRSVVSAQLDNTCQSRDFYSGFYVERPGDGQLCVNRDKLQARSGANCKIRKLRALVMGARRFP